MTSLLTPKSRVMLLNFPNNLTGSISARVITVPWSLFGALGEGYVGLSFTADYSKLEEAFARMEKTVSGLKHG